MITQDQNFIYKSSINQIMKIRSKLFVLLVSLILITLLAATFVSINVFSTAMIREIRAHLEDNSPISSTVEGDVITRSKLPLPISIAAFLSFVRGEEMARSTTI